MFEKVMINKYTQSIDLESESTNTIFTLPFDSNVQTHETVRSTSDGTIIFNVIGLYEIHAFVVINSKTGLLNTSCLVGARAIFKGVNQPPSPLIKIFNPTSLGATTGGQCWIGDTVFPTLQYYYPGDTLKYQVFCDGNFSNDAIIEAQSLSFDNIGVIPSYYVVVYRHDVGIPPN